MREFLLMIAILCFFSSKIYALSETGLLKIEDSIKFVDHWRNDKQPNYASGIFLYKFQWFNCFTVKKSADCSLKYSMELTPNFNEDDIFLLYKAIPAENPIYFSYRSSLKSQITKRLLRYAAQCTIHYKDFSRLVLFDPHPNGTEVISSKFHEIMSNCLQKGEQALRAFLLE